MAAKKLHLFVGTYKGAFILTTDRSRKKWKMTGPFLKGSEVNHIMMDTRGEPVVYASANSSWFGPGFKMTRNLGTTWEESEKGIRFDENSGKKVERIWAFAVGPADKPDVIYAGVDPGALFKSEDGGKTWEDVKGLTNHPTREKWNPGAGGLMVHSICLHPMDQKRIYVGISAAGTFFTQDGGASWEPRNKGVLADFQAEKYPEVGQCVHHLEAHPANPDVLYQQNHCGVYRSDNGGKEWVDISKGLPSRFGFPFIIHPHDPNTVFVIPEEGAEFRSAPKGEFAIYRSKNRGNSWKKMTKGLPTKNAYMHVYRQGTSTDNLDKAGLYVGTSNGQIYYSTSDGDSWKLLTEFLPPIYSLSTAVV